MTRSVKISGVITTLMVLVLALSTARVQAAPTDGTIKFWVQNAVIQDPHMDTAGIQVEVDNGIVTLSGTVNSLASRSYAILEAQKIDGVRGVIDKLTVQPTFRWDTDIAQDVRQRLVWDPAIASESIRAGCSDGKVTLEGQVSSMSEKQEAGLVASEVRGVRSIQDDLTVLWGTTRSDDAIQKDILSAIHRDVYLTRVPIEVAVSKGHVTLTGRVGNEYEKLCAAEDVTWVNNVTGLDNALKVEWGERTGTRSQSPIPSDEDLRAAVMAELSQDSRIHPLDMTVLAELGHVTLAGTVPYYNQKQIAEDDVKDVVGVAWVTNNLTVRPEKRDDSAIQADVLANMATDEALWDQGVDVKVNDAVVTLSGNVNTTYDRLHATTVAARIRGVRDVVNLLGVNWNPQYRDAELMQRVVARLKADYLLASVADRITVMVERGRVTLTGTVTNWGERSEADRVTFFTAGVQSIDNRIRVEGYRYPWPES